MTLVAEGGPKLMLLLMLRLALKKVLFGGKWEMFGPNLELACLQFFIARAVSVEKHSNLGSIVPLTMFHCHFDVLRSLLIFERSNDKIFLWKCSLRISADASRENLFIIIQSVIFTSMIIGG